MKIDLHAHTNYSDGIFTPEELVQIAIRENVDCFALTDHDSVFGCDEIQKVAKEYHIHVISGMELSTEYKKEPCHIVCLFPNNAVPQELIAFSINKKRSREERAIKMMQNVADIYGLKVDISALIRDNEVITRANMLYHIAKLNHLSQKEAEIYVDKNSKAYIPSTKLSTKEGLKMVKDLGCITILAHPCLLPREYVEEIIKLGVDGIEVYYPKNKDDDAKYFNNLAKKYNLLISGGSDFHGDEGTKHAMIGTSTISEKEFGPILERLCLKW